MAKKQSQKQNKILGLLGSETSALPKDCRIEAVNLELSETRVIAIIGLSVNVVVFELDNGFQIRSDEEHDSENILPWFSIEELKEILDWLAQFREQASGNEELNFEKLWQSATNSKNTEILCPEKPLTDFATDAILLSQYPD